MSVTECEICGEEVSKVYTCERCGVLFCRYCGSPSEKLCVDCLEEDVDEEEKEESEDEED
jgi:hypothetical protein